MTLKFQGKGLIGDMMRWIGADGSNVLETDRAKLKSQRQKPISPLQLPKDEGPQGRVRIFALSPLKAEAPELLWDDPNIVVQQGRAHLARLLSDFSSVSRVTQLQLGTGGVQSGTLIPPGYNDIALVTPVFTKAISSVGYEPGGIETTVVFSTTLFESEANGPGDSEISYTEAGLLLNTNALFARETFVPVIKSPSRRLIFEWSILF